MDPTSQCITTLIPTYNRADLLVRAVRSALAQTHENLRVAVFDNASTDHTCEVVRQLQRQDSRLTYHRHASNIGGLANFRFAHNAVRTPFFSFLSDDDLLLPQFYERAMSALTANPRARLFFGLTVVHVARTGHSYVYPRNHSWTNGLYEPGLHLGSLVRGGFVWTGSVMSAELRDRIGELDMAPSNDLFYVLRAATRLPFCVDLTPVAIFAVHGDNFGHLLGMDGIRENFDCARELFADLRSEGVDVEDLDRAFRAMCVGDASSRLYQAVVANDPSLAREVKEFLEQLGELSPRRARRADLVIRGGIRAEVFRRFVLAKQSLRRWRQSLRGESIEQLLARLTSPEFAAVITAKPDRRLPAQPGSSPSQPFGSEVLSVGQSSQRGAP